MKTNAKGFQRSLNEKVILGMNPQDFLKSIILSYVYPYLPWPSLSNITEALVVIVLITLRLIWNSTHSVDKYLLNTFNVLDIVLGKSGGASLFPQRANNMQCELFKLQIFVD